MKKSMLKSFNLFSEILESEDSRSFPFLSSNEDFNKEILFYNTALVKEAVKHFDSCKFVPSKNEPYDERYFFSKTDLDAFFNINKNPLVHSRVLNDENGEFFCYEIYRVKGEGPVYNTKNKNKDSLKQTNKTFKY